MVVVRSFYFGLNTFSPFGINHQNGELESPLCSPLVGPYTLSPIGKRNMSQGSYQLRVSGVTTKGK
jgi:hypothetical protein